MGHDIRPLHEAFDAALELVALDVARQAPISVAPTVLAVGPEEAAAAALAPWRDPDVNRSGWAALDASGRAVAVLAATLREIRPGDFEYTYMPPRFATVARSGWAFRSADDLSALDPLLAALAADAAPRGIARLQVQVRAGDWLVGGALRARGLRDDTVLAARPVDPPLTCRDDVLVRHVAARDHDAIVALAFEEYRHHARHTETGTIEHQDPEPTDANVRERLAAKERGELPTLVAVDDADGPIGVLELHALTVPEQAAGRAYLPASHGYIGMTSVTEAARGRGVGRALAARGLARLAERGFDVAMLHYVDDNRLSRGFWRRAGFSPIVDLLAGDVLHADHVR